MTTESELLTASKALLEMAETGVTSLGTIRLAREVIDRAESIGSVTATETALTDFQIDNVAAGTYGTRATPQELAFARAIEQAVLQSAEVQRLLWISVEDRLPPDDDAEVIALHRGSEPEIVYGHLIHETHVDEVYSHWMPIPPPPQHDN